jgi:hypothetical protein
MWNLTPDEITASLHENDSDDQSASAESQIKVTLLQDVPVELRSKMTKIR